MSQTTSMMPTEELSEEEINTRLEMLTSGDSREEFLVELERRMVAGYTFRQRRLWAKMEYDIDSDQVSQIESLIKHGWKLEMIDLDVMFRRQDAKRKYLMVFQAALEDKNYKEANKAVDSIVRLEGLALEKVVVNNNTTNNTLNANMTVTSQTRERVSTLLERMRELAGRKSPAVIDAAVSETTMKGIAKNPALNGRFDGDPE